MGAGLESYGLLARPSARPLFRPAPRDAQAPFQLAHILLLPWSGRISGGGFSSGDVFHALAPNVEGEALPIHGNAFSSVWQVEQRRSAAARLGLASDGPGPYRYVATVSYALHSGALTITLTVENRAEAALPYGLGFHPWFPRTKLTTLRFGAQTVWLEDARHLPTGSAPVASRPDWDFSTARGLPGGALHAWFTGWDGAAGITWPERGIALDIAAEPPLSSCVVYSTGLEAEFFCFEPVSHPVDAHNLPGGGEAHGLVMLQPGEAMSSAASFVPRRL